MTKNQDYMIHSVRFTCVLDTNVIYPINIRDLLFWFASYDLFTPKWSRHIFSEWEKVMKRKGIPDEEIKKRLSKAQLAFPDALVHNYEVLINALELPDEKDRHILAAAIKTNANIIVTNNIKDFPEEYLASFGLAAKTADDFITDTIDLNTDLALEAFKALVLNRTNPDLDEFEILNRFRKNGLNGSANYLHALL
jgi:predicted nucleic acid-binding protein